jgi:2,3-bisphosphoglycerate-independent phosphoglycerate mutase
MSKDFRLLTLDGVTPRPGPLVLVVMDGVGLGRGDEGDAVARAFTPTLDAFRATCPFVKLAAHGTAVGMPSDDDMGNSEVGHNALGCGRVFDQGAKLVDGAIASGAIFRGGVWKEVIARGRAGGTVHFIGLLSDGNVHSHMDHLIALLVDADRSGVSRVRVHPLLDGRDVGETSALLYVDALEQKLREIESRPGRSYRIASGGGRMVVTMDRYEADWRIVERGWKAHVLGEGRAFPDARTAIETFRAETPGLADQFLPPFVVTGPAGPAGPILNGDAVVFFNFRGDRAIEITRAFDEESFDHFDRVRRPKVLYAGMMEYDGDQHLPGRFLVEPPAIDRTLTEYLCANGIAQFAAAETQKYGHVTYFWNGNCSGLLDPATGRYVDVPAEIVRTARYEAHVRRSALETHLEIRSDQVPFEERPWMKAAEVTDALLAEVRTGRFRFARVNYANGDMVGHTGHLPAAMAAVAAVDLCLARLKSAVAAMDGLLVVTADHGNADEMLMMDRKTKAPLLDAGGRPQPKTAHTLNPVPFLVYDPRSPGAFHPAQGIEAPGLSNVAATVLHLLGFAPPEGYRPSLLA